MKAQVQVGGRGKAGGIKLANDADEVRDARRQHPRHGHQGPHRRGRLDRAGLRHRRGVLRQLHPRPGGQEAPRHAVGQGGVEIETVADEDPDAIAKIWIDPVDGLTEARARDVGRGRQARTPTATDGAVDILLKLYRGLRRGRRRPRRDQPADPHARRARCTRSTPRSRSTTTPTFRHPTGASTTPPRCATSASRRPTSKGLQYVGLDGYGRHHRQRRRAGHEHASTSSTRSAAQPANFLDIGGGANADVMAGALEVINNDPNVQVDLHQHLRRHHPGRRGGQRHRRRRSAGSSIDAPDRDPPRRHQRRRGPGDPRAAPVRQAADRSRPCSTRPAPPSSWPARPRRASMSIFVDENTKVVYQGLTGSPGPLLRPAATATTAPRSWPAPTRRRPAPTSTASRSSRSVGRRGGGDRRHRVVHLHPGAGRAGRGDGGGRGRHRVHRRASPRACPRRTRRGSTTSCKRDFPQRAAARPELPRHHQPRQVQHRHHRRRTSPRPGGPVGIVSRSGTLTYQALYELKQQDIGVTTCVGIGGDPVPGTSFIDCLERVRGRPRDQGRDDDRRDRRLGRGGGGRVHQDEDDASRSSAYIAGVTAPPGKKMGHAGAIVSGGKGTAAAKMEALRDAGVQGRQQPHRGRRAHGRHRQRTCRPTRRPSQLDARAGRLTRLLRRETETGN